MAEMKTEWFWCPRCKRPYSLPVALAKFPAKVKSAWREGLPLRQARSIAVCLAVVFVGPACRKATPTRPAPAASRSALCPVVRVVDGDTIRVIYRGKEERVRLLCIDTPEKGRAGFEEAAQAMRRLVEGRTVRLEFEEPGVEKRDRYGRLLAYVFVNVNVEMVRLGHSRFWTKYGRGRYAEQFGRAEPEAR